MTYSALLRRQREERERLQKEHDQEAVKLDNLADEMSERHAWQWRELKLRQKADRQLEGRDKRL